MIICLCVMTLLWQGLCLSPHCVSDAGHSDWLRVGALGKFVE